MITKKARDPHTSEFQQWWDAFPRKVGKLAAEREYQRARTKASADELLAGIGHYLEAKAPYADLVHPRTFLSQGRWLDQAASSVSVAWVCPHIERCQRRSQCLQATLLGRPEKGQASA